MRRATVCQYEWTPDGEQRQRYTSTADPDFNLCSECLFVPWSAWLAQRDTFMRGGAVRFSEVRYGGLLAVGDRLPASDDRDGLLAMIDGARRRGDLEWQPKATRVMELSGAALVLKGHPRGGPEEEMKTYVSLDLAEVQSVVYISDVPQHLLLITAGQPPKAVCHIVLCHSAEMAGAVVEACDNVLQFVFTQSVLHDMDDQIAAGVEGRQTAAEGKAAERARIAAMEEVLGSPEPGAQDPPGSKSPDRRGSVMEFFGTAAPPAQHKPSERRGSSRPPARAPTEGAIIQEYMKRLQELFNTTELKEFAGLMRQYRTGGGLEVMVGQLVELYGPGRKFLLPGIKDFIPPEDKAQFEVLLAAS